MSEQAPLQPIPGMENPNANPGTINGVSAPEAADISMTDAPAAQPPQPQPQPPASSTTPTTAPSSIPPPSTTGARTTTPIPPPTPGQIQNQAQAQPPQPTSRAASVHPDTTALPTSSNTGPSMPAEATPHGAPVRQYINSKITGHLLEGMKIVAREQPKDPLRVLGEFLLQRSKELEGKESNS